MTRVVPIVILLAVGVGLTGHTVAQSPAWLAPTARDFPKVGGNYGNWNYSSLARITGANVVRLGGAWHVDVDAGAPPAAVVADAVPDARPGGGRGDAGAGRGGRGGRGDAAGGRGGRGGGGAAGQQSTAVVVDGVLYVENSTGRVLAIDGKTGAIKWSYSSGFGNQLRRGVAVGGGKVFTAAAGKRIIALDQRSGAVVWQTQLDANDGSGGSLKTPITYFDGMIYFGNADAQRGIGYAFDAATGEEVWRFYGPAGTGEFGNDTWEGESWRNGGASPWMHPAIDPDLGLVYWTFGNARGGGGPTDGGARGGQNLFANSLVALNARTGQRVWHFQSVHHDIWDMDNVMAPILADITVDGRLRKVVVYGSKTGMYFVLDRADGSAVTPIEEVPVPQEPRQKTWPTQPIPAGDSVLPTCANADSTNRVPPHYEAGCLFIPHLDFPVVQAPGTGGGMTWNALSFNPTTGLLYTGVGIVNSAHVRQGGGVGFRPLGQDRSGRIVAFNPATHKVAWSKNTTWSLAHGNGILSTAGGVMFIGQPDGVLLAMDIRDGREMWRFQTGAGVHTSPITYEIDGEQYLAVLAGGNGLPYNSPRGDELWAFKIGGTLPQAAAPTPPPLRQPITAAAVEGGAVSNTIVLARVYADGAIGLEESSAEGAMAPQHLRVPVGTTVTFVNPRSNEQPHCATQFFEGLFDRRLAPGESFTYTFTRAGEYFYNDCTSPRTTGKVVVY